MSTELKGFITRDDFTTPRNQDVSPIYELSETAYTYAKTKSVIYPTEAQTHALHVFQLTGSDSLSNSQSRSIVRVVQEFTSYLTNASFVTKLQTIVNFTNTYNGLYPADVLVDLDYNSIVTYNNIKAPDYLTFTVAGIACSIWLSDDLFRAFYSGYEISTVLPFDQFTTIIQNTSDMIDAVIAFDPVVFNARVETDKAGFPPTYTKLLNIPYRVPNTDVERNCYFGFNIYGKQGNYDHILKLELYRVLTVDLGLSGAFVESIFPSILKINEFFVTPRWDKFAIMTQVGQVGINSQLSLTYIENFDLNKFISVYDNVTYLRNNTYSLPVPYNNMLLNITNGYYSEDAIKLFNQYYPDIISVPSTHPDFDRMSTRTQRFIVLLEVLLDIANSGTETELFNKVVRTQDYQVGIINRGGISYISVFYDKHQYYVIPRYQFFALA